MTEPVQLLKHALQQKAEQAVSTGATPATVQTIPLKSAKYGTTTNSLPNITYDISEADPPRIINHGNGLLTLAWIGIPLPTGNNTVSGVLFEIDTSILSLDYTFVAFTNGSVEGREFHPLTIALSSNQIIIKFITPIQTSTDNLAVVATGPDLHSLGLEDLYN